MRKQLILALIGMGTLVGCAAPALDPQLKSSLRTIRVEAVELAEAPAVSAPGANRLAVLPGSGGAAGMQQAEPDIRLAYKAMVYRSLDIGSELENQLKGKLQQKGFTLAASGTRPDATLKTRATYGLSVVSTTNDNRAVSLIMFAELIGQDGRVLYRHMYFTGGDKELVRQSKAAPLEQWLMDSALVKEQNKLMAERAAIGLTQGL
jgi:hypothetical protein